MNRKVSTKGFTLFEVMVVVVLIAIAGSMLVFGFDQTVQRRKDAEVDELYSWLSAAADTAVFQSTVVGVAQRDEQLILLAFYQDDWFLLADQPPFLIDGELELRWSQVLLDNAEFYASNDSYADDRVSPYLVLMPSGEILPKGDISLFDTLLGKDVVRATIQWQEGNEFVLTWQEGS